MNDPRTANTNSAPSMARLISQWVNMGLQTDNLLGKTTVVLALAFAPVFSNMSMESGVTTLTMPYNSRQIAMGEVGVSLADDEAVQFCNPAGLGLDNARWRYGAASYFFEKPLPHAVPAYLDIGHSAYSACFQPSPRVGGFNISGKYENFGENTWTDELGRELGRARSYELVLGLISYGRSLKGLTKYNHSLGLSFKYVHSALAPGFGAKDEGIGRTFAVDFGYLFKSPFGLRIGTVLANMGPSIFYISRDEAAPIPFSIKCAIGYKNKWKLSKNNSLGFAAEYLVSREFVKNYIDKPPDRFWVALISSWPDKSAKENWNSFWHNFGYELVYQNTVAWRQGLLIDNLYNDKEMHWGFGVSLLNHFQFDFHRIKSLGDPTGRDGQWGFSISLFNIFRWRREDLKWFKQ